MTKKIKRQQCPPLSLILSSNCGNGVHNKKWVQQNVNFSTAITVNLMYTVRAHLFDCLSDAGASLFILVTVIRYHFASLCVTYVVLLYNLAARLTYLCV